ncbi:MAG: DMT family transporter [Patescibacteria group bacterium]|jgi:drug/metabolite transporter (DMT)-like permease
MFNAIIASLGYAGGVLTDKIIVGRDKTPIKIFMPVLFIALCVITGLLTFRWGGIDYDLAKTDKFLFLFILMIVVSISWNGFYYRGIQKEDLHEFELIMLLSPLVTIILATIFLPDERNYNIIIPSIIASLALIFTNLKKNHLVISKTAKGSIFGMILMSFELILIKVLLDAYSPASLYFIRTLVIAIIFLFAYRPKFSISFKTTGLIILSAVFGVIQMVLKFYGFKNIGVIETTMILLLGPAIVYVMSGFWLKEKIKTKDIVAVSVIASSVLYVTIVG